MLLLGAVFWCRPQEAFASAEASVNLYYLSSGEDELKSASYVPAGTAREDILPELFLHLSNRSEQGGLKALLPEGVDITSYEVLDGILYLHFNSLYREMRPEREILVRLGLLRTFTQVPGISAISIYVENEPLSSSRGVPVGVLSGEDFLELPDSDREAYRYESFTLYFTDSTGTLLLPEERHILYRCSIPKARVALEQLAKGPLEEGHYPTIPDSAVLHGITQSNDICYLNYNTAFLNDAIEGVQPSVVISSVVDTLLSATGAKLVQIMVDRREEITFRNAVNLYRYFRWNADFFPAESLEEEAASPEGTEENTDDAPEGAGLPESGEEAAGSDAAVSSAFQAAPPANEDISLPPPESLPIPEESGSAGAEESREGVPE